MAAYAETAPNHVLLYSPQLGHAITLPQGTVTVGRALGCFLVIRDPLVSREHLRLQVGSQVILEDLGSQNGTWVNGQQIEGRRVLVDGDQITVGGRSFTLRVFTTSREEDDAPTPTDVMRSTTLLGVGAVMQRTCHGCGGELSPDAKLCPRCGQTWRSSDSTRDTEDHAEVSAETAARLRRHARHEVSLPVRYASRNLSADAVLLDLSLGGAFLSAAQIDAVGSSCTVSLPGAKPGEELVLKGFVRNVIHRGRTGMGIEFAALDDRQRRGLEALLAKPKPARA
jgi:hypothetical protein